MHILWYCLFGTLFSLHSSMIKRDESVNFTRARWQSNLFRSMNVPFNLNDEIKQVMGMGFRANLMNYYIVPGLFKSIKLCAINGLSLYIRQNEDASLTLMDKQVIHAFDANRCYGSVSLTMPQFKINDKLDNNFYVTLYGMYDISSLNSDLIKRVSSSNAFAVNMPQIIAINGSFTFAIVGEKSRIIDEQLVILQKNILAHGYVTNPVAPESWLTMNVDENEFLYAK